MTSFIKKVKIISSRILFENFAIPAVKKERISKAVFKKYLPNKMVIVDCGSHDGADSVELAKLFKNATIHSFEPVDALYARLLKNANPYKNIFCYKIALADRCGTMDFYISEGGSDGSSSLLEPKDHLIDYPDTFFEKKIIVNTLTLDAWAQQQQIDKIDLLWLDMQGFELNMLKASPKILSTVSLIHTEVSTKETYKGVSLYGEYRAYLENNGFKVLIEAMPAQTDMGNVLFMRK